MLKRQQAEEPAVSITSEEVEAALGLLKSEEQEAASDARSVRAEIAEDIAMAFALFGLLTGALVIGFQAVEGAFLLGVGFAGFVIFGVLPRSDVAERTHQLRHSLEEVLPGSEMEDTSVGLSSVGLVGFLLGIGAFLAGLAWLLVELITADRVSVPALAMVGGTLLAYWLWFARDTIREWRYVSRISELRQRLAEEAAGDAEGVSVSPTDRQVLAEAETHRTHRVVREATAQAAELSEAYAVAVAPEPLEYLDELARRNPADWIEVTQTIQALQFDPRPPSARPLAELPDETAEMLLAAGREVEYVVNEDLHRVDILAIEHKPSEGGSGHG